MGEDVYFNPLLPVRKLNGTFQFTNHFRLLTTFFPQHLWDVTSGRVKKDVGNELKVAIFHGN